MKNKQLYDLCEMYKIAYTVTDYSNNYVSILTNQIVVRFVSKLYTNLPYALIKFKKRVAEQDKKYPKGTFFKIVKNGESSIKIKK